MLETHSDSQTPSIQSKSSTFAYLPNHHHHITYYGAKHTSMDYRETLKDLRKESLSIGNRLRSILHDAEFVSKFDVFGFPIVANERCGLWYVRPENLAESTYFKSTDGHTHQWSFSMRRLNFHLLPVLGKNGGCVIVDSTRKGKLIPDALLKSIPIWCAVLNYVLFDGKIMLHTPSEMVSESEHSSIAARIAGFADQLLLLGLMDKQGLLERLGSKKPIVPVWAYPELKPLEISDDVFTVVCLTASSARKPNLPWQYVQGGGDDHELWAPKEVCSGNLDAGVFWNVIVPECSEELRVVNPDTKQLFHWLSEGELISRINEIYSKRAKKAASFEYTALGETGVLLGSIQGDVPYESVAQHADSVVLLSLEYSITGIPEKHIPVHHHRIESSKKGCKQLREVLPLLIAQLDPSRVLVLCESGKDLSVGVAICLLSQNYNQSWQPQKGLPATKDSVKIHLGKILDLRKVNPSRNTLQSVNSYLMK